MILCGKFNFLLIWKVLTFWCYQITEEEDVLERTFIWYFWFNNEGLYELHIYLKKNTIILQTFKIYHIKDWIKSSFASLLPYEGCKQEVIAILFQHISFIGVKYYSY